jgi:hypothetical protein
MKISSGIQKLIEMGIKRHREIRDGNGTSLLLFLQNKECRLKGDTYFGCHKFPADMELVDFSTRPDGLYLKN